jgi:DNA-directed RNA polymerase specialized sigma subunit
MTQIKIKKKRRKRTTNHYFTKVHEQAIIDYVATEEMSERERLYRDYIGPAFDELVDKIVYTYKFTTLPNIDSLRDECKIWLTTILDKFDPNKGSKAFSYFSVVTKNWFIHKVKKNSVQVKREIYYDDLNKDLESKYVMTDESYIKSRENNEFWRFLYEEINSWNSNNMKTNEEKVYKAVMVLFESTNDIEIFNKKAIYLYIRELTGLNTKQVVNNLNKMRSRYKTWKIKWNKGEI